MTLARQTSQYYGLKHHVSMISEADFRSDYAPIIAAMDLPTIDGVNTWFVSRAAAEAGYKVAISGLGADEILGGYPSLVDVPAIMKCAGSLAQVPLFGRWFRWITAGLVSQFTSPKFAGIFEYGGTYGGANLLRRALYMPWELPMLIDPEIVKQGWVDLQPLNANSSRARVSGLELQYYMRNMLLRDSDWARMARCLEIRLPFADVEFYRHLAPYISGLHPPSKAMLLKCPSTPAPKVVLNRSKSGFGVPIDHWITKHRTQDRGLRGWGKKVVESFVTDKHIINTRS